jgi:hypothetical protein
MHSPTDSTATEEFNLVETWLRVDRVRWIAGVMAGLFAGLVAIGLGGVLAAVSGLEFWFPIKLMATIVLGAQATEVGMILPAILTGLVVFEALCAFWGFVYGHFVKTNSLGPLLAMGVVWGLLAWIFNWNLFMHSIRTIVAADVSPGATFPVCMTYGVALTSIAFFDRALRGSR